MRFLYTTKISILSLKGFQYVNKFYFLFQKLFLENKFNAWVFLLVYLDDLENFCKSIEWRSFFMDRKEAKMFMEKNRIWK